MKDHHRPDLRPDQVHGFVRIGHIEVEPLDHLLPGQRVDEAVQKHQKHKHIEQDAAQTVSVELHGRRLGEHAGKGKQQNIQM